MGIPPEELNKILDSQVDMTPRKHDFLFGCHESNCSVEFIAHDVAEVHGIIACLCCESDNIAMVPRGRRLTQEQIKKIVKDRVHNSQYKCLNLNCGLKFTFCDIMEHPRRNVVICPRCRSRNFSVLE